MQTTVYSPASTPDDPHVFVGCRWKVDDAGCLHIFRQSAPHPDRAPNSDRTVMVAAFGAGSWFLVHADAEVVAV